MKERVLSHLDLVPPIALGLIGILFLAIGSGADLAVSSALSDFPAGSLISIFFGIVAPFPFYIFIATSGAFLASGLFHGKKPGVVSICITAASSIVSGILYGLISIGQFIDSRILAVAIGIITVAIVSYAVLFSSRGIDRSRATAFSASVICAAALAIAFSLAFSLISLRPSFAAINGGSEGMAPFRPWYDFAPALLDEYPGLRASQLASFPSLPVMASASSFAGLSAFGLYFGNRKNADVIMGSGIAALTLLLSLGELIDGSHYLSDIGFSLIVGSAIGASFHFLFVVPVTSARKKRAMRKSPLTPGIIAFRIKLRKEKEESRRLPLRRKNGRIKAVVPSTVPSIFSKRRNYSKKRA